jgi:hypothetical protein
MTRELARELKHANFPVGAYRVGHVFIRLSAVVNGAKIPGVTA